MELTVTSDDMANVADAQGGAVDGSEEDVVPEQGDSTEDNVTSEQAIVEKRGRLKAQYLYPGTYSNMNEQSQKVKTTD